MKVNKKILALIIFSLIVMLISSLLITGCGRRARIAAAIKEQRQQESQEQETAQQTQVEETQDLETGQTGDTAIDTEIGQDTTIQTELQEDTEEQETETVETTQEEVVEETSLEEETVEEITEETEEEQQEINADMPLIPAESGNIAGGELLDYPFIFMGEDGEADDEVRGFVSFDISQLAGATITAAKISGTANIINGTPFQCYGPIIIKAVYWGQREPAPSDFDIDGVEVLNFQKKNFGLSSDVLKNDLQNIVNSGVDRYQLIFYFEIDQINDDGEQDNISYDFSCLQLNVTYIP